MKLFTQSSKDYKVAKVLITAKYCGVELDVVENVNSKEAGSISIAGKLPVLETSNGNVSYSNAILRYIARLAGTSDLTGRDSMETAMVDQWIDFGATGLEPHAAVWTYPLLDVKNMPRVSSNALRAAKSEVRSRMAVMDAHLASRTFLVGERVSLADICLAAGFLHLFKLVLTEADATAYPHLTRWFLTCVNQPTFNAVLGPVTLHAGAPVIPATVPTPSPAAVAAAAARAPSAAVMRAAGEVAGAMEGKASGGAGSLEGAECVVAQVPSAPTLFRRNRVRVQQVLDAGLAWEGRALSVAGWVKTMREQGKGAFAFVELNDGSGFNSLQVMVLKESTEGFAEALACGGVGASLSFVGTLLASPAKGQAVELHAASVKVLGTVDAARYPLAKKRHKLETLRGVPHLRPRTNIIGAVARVRNACSYATHQFFQRRGFLYVHTPLITSADCEGAGEMFSVTSLLDESGSIEGIPRTPAGKIDFSKDFFSSRSFLTVSGQLNVECYAVSMGDVYTFGPTFRAENSHTSRHLAEFWMIEPELVFADINDNMDVAEDYLKFCVRFVMENCADDVAFFDKMVEKGLKARLENVLAEPFARITYTDAINLLNEPKHLKAGKFDEPPNWGIDLGSEHERYLTEKVFQKPTIVTDYPKDIKAFYMKMNPDHKTVAAMDILVPRIGELMGGSQREEDLTKLNARLAELEMDPEHFNWYMDLRRYGSVPHSGFGLGFERLIMFCTGVENIRDVIPFPRYPGHAEV